MSHIWPCVLFSYDYLAILLRYGTQILIGNPGSCFRILRCGINQFSHLARSRLKRFDDMRDTVPSLRLSYSLAPRSFTMADHVYRTVEDIPSNAGQALHHTDHGLTAFKDAFYFCYRASTQTPKKVWQARANHVPAYSLSVIIHELYALIQWYANNLVKGCKQSSKNRHLRRETTFWTSLPLQLIVGDVGLALALRQVWILYGVCAVVFFQILSILHAWVLYILNDNELKAAAMMMKGYCYLLLEQGEKTLNGDAARTLVAGVVLRQAPGGFGYFRYIVRFRTHQMNSAVIKDMVEEQRYRVLTTAERKAQLREIRQSLIAKIDKKKEKVKASLLS